MYELSMTVDYAMIGVAMALVVVALGRSAMTTLRRRESLIRVDILAPLAVAAIAFALRWFVAPHSPLHENHHGYIPLVAPSLDAPPLHHGVPSSAHLLVWALVPGGPGSDGYVFLLGAIMASVAVLWTYVFVREVGGSTQSGLIAAVLMATMPLLVRVGPTEVKFQLALGFLIPGLTLLLRGLRRPSVWTTIAGVALVVLAATTRVLTLAYAVAAGLVILGAVPSWRRPPWGLLLVALGGLTVGLLPHAGAVLGVVGEHGEGQSLMNLHGLLAPFRSTGPWVDVLVPPWWVPLALVSMGGAVVVAVGKRRWSFLPILVLAPLVIQIASRLVVHQELSQMRHQLVAQAILAVPSGWALGELAALVGSWRRLAGTIATVVIAVAASTWIVVGWPALVAETEWSAEYQILASWAKELPQGAVVVGPRTMEPMIHTVDPAWIGSQVTDGRGLSFDLSDPASFPTIEADPSAVRLFTVVDISCAATFDVDLVPSPVDGLAMLSPACARYLSALDASVVATSEVAVSKYFPFYPYLARPTATIALLEIHSIDLDALK